MFQLEPYDQLDIELYNMIQENISTMLKLTSTREYSGHVEEVYRFGNTEYYLEIFYKVPSAHNIRAIAASNLTIDYSFVETPKFGVFNNDTYEPVPLSTAIHVLPKGFRKLICFNLDHFAEMKDVFENYEEL